MARFSELEPVVGADGRMITAVIPQMTLPKAPTPQPTPQPDPPPDPYAGLGIKESVPQSDPYAGLGVDQPLSVASAQGLAPQDPYAGLGVDQPLPIPPAPLAPVAPAIQAPPPSPELDEKDWRDALLSSHALDVLPFVGGIRDATNSVNMLLIAGKVERGEATTEEKAELNSFLIDSQRPTTFGYSLTQGLLQLPGFAIELGLTGGAYTAGKAITAKVLKRGLLKYASSKAGRAAIAATSRVIGVAAQTAAARAPSVIAGTADRMMPTMQLSPDDTEKFNFAITHDEDGLVKAFAKSFTTQMIEVGTERAGGLIDRLPAAHVFQKGLERFLRIHPTAGVAKFMDMTRNKLLRNSFIAEFMEEEIAKPMHVLLGTETSYRGKENTMAKRVGEQYNFRNYLLQTAILSVPTVGGVALQKLTTPSKAELAKMAVEKRAEVVAKYKEDLRSNLVDTLGVPAEVVDQSGVIEKMALANDAAEREQVLNDFAEKNLAGVVEPAPAEVDVAPKPAEVVLPAVTAEEQARIPPEPTITEARQPVPAPVVAPVEPVAAQKPEIVPKAG